MDLSPLRTIVALMDHPVIAQILIVARLPETAQAWSVALAGEGCRIWLALQDVPPDVRGGRCPPYCATLTRQRAWNKRIMAQIRRASKAR